MRQELCEKIAYMWREAENKYLASDYSDDSEKQKVLEYQMSMNLSAEEIIEVRDIAESMGV